MQPVIYPIEKKKLIAELTEEHFMRKTNKGGNEIYTFDAHSAPNPVSYTHLIEIGLFPRKIV